MTRDTIRELIDDNDMLKELFSIIKAAPFEGLHFHVDDPCMPNRKCCSKLQMSSPRNEANARNECRKGVLYILEAHGRYMNA